MRRAGYQPLRTSEPASVSKYKVLHPLMHMQIHAMQPATAMPLHASCTPLHACSATTATKA